MRLFGYALVLSAVLVCGAVARAQSGSATIDRYPALNQQSASERNADWAKRLADQKKKIIGLEEELVALEREQQQLDTQCAFKNCQINAWTETGAGSAPSDDPADKKYSAAKQRIDTKRKELDDARQKYDAMLQQVNEETGRR